MNVHFGEWSRFNMALPEPFSWDEVLVYLNRSSNECLHQVTGRVVTKCVVLPDAIVLLRITSEESITLVVDYCCAASDVPSPNVGIDSGDGDIQAEIRQYIAEWFDLDRDLAPFYDMAKDDSVLRNIAEEYAGLRIVGVPDLFEVLCFAIVGQQVNLAFAYTLKKRLVETFGDRVAHEGVDYWMFPTPDSLLGATVHDLRSLQFTERKSEYVLGVARLCATGELSKRELLELDPQAAEQRLVAVRGIGPWTAQYASMRCLHHQDACPLQDVGLHQALQRQLGLERKPSLEEVVSVTDLWKGWRAYAVFYLWRSLHT